MKAIQEKIEQFILNWGKPALAATHESFKSELLSLLEEVAEETVDKCLEAIPDQPPETHIHYVDEIIEDIRNRIGNVKNEL